MQDWRCPRRTPARRLSGRPEHLRADALAWLARHGIGDQRLLMRRSNDRRPSARFKVEAVQELARKRHIAIVIDDDASVIEGMKAAGYPTLLADWEQRDTSTKTALKEAQEVEGRT